jgi:hypothetical protein
MLACTASQGCVLGCRISSADTAMRATVRIAGSIERLETRQNAAFDGDRQSRLIQFISRSKLWAVLHCPYMELHIIVIVLIPTVQHVYMCMLIL